VTDDAPGIADEPASPVEAASAASASLPERSAEGAGTSLAAARAKGASGTALLLGDATGALLLANEARYRTLERFGIRREDANLATAIGLLTVANAVYERAHRPKVPKPPTAVANLTIATGALRESIYGIAGPASRDTPLGGTLVALAVLVGLTRPPLRQGLHEIKASSLKLKRAFRGRYGHLVNLGRDD
jgi:hypothetical protein